ncbi:MAG: hypothetical protein K2G25_02205 [Oscillospiraceae bacterium]|nr:hypothetical protein [Oscillospiraceae bacterium]
MDAKTYESMQGIGKTGQALEKFGEEQNQLNQKLLKQIRILELQNNLLSRQMKEVQAELAKLKETQVRNILKLGRCEAEIEILKQENKRSEKDAALENLKREVNRLRLTAKLNTNAIERLTKNQHEENQGDDLSILMDGDG